jgi:hypothetical protein
VKAGAEGAEDAEVKVRASLTRPLTFAETTFFLHAMTADVNIFSFYWVHNTRFHTFPLAMGQWAK